MELALTFSSADATLIEKYAAQRNMSVLDFARHAVMNSVDEEAERAKRNAAMSALKKLQKDMDGVGEAVGLESDEAVAAWVTESRRAERLAP